MNPLEHKTFEAEVKAFDDEKLWIEHFISTEKRDRGRDILKAAGMKVFGRVVVLHTHGWGPMGSEPIAKNLFLKAGEFKGKPGIMARTQFYDGSHLNPPDNTGQRLYEKTKTGVMPNWSIGWRPLKEEYVTEKGGEVTRVVSEWELLEYSIVAVPMQPDAQTLPSGKEDPPIKDAIQFKVFSELEEKRGELIAWRGSLEDPWQRKPYPNEHACRVQDPKKYIRIRRENDAMGAGVHAIWGIQEGNKPVELQAIHFSSSKFTAAEARAWLKKHNRTCILFEPATGKEEPCGCGDKGRDPIDIWKDSLGTCQKCGGKMDALEGVIFCPACSTDDKEEAGHRGTDKADEDTLGEKGVIPYKKTPLAAEGETWDAGAEVRAAEVADLKIMCFWFDSDAPDLKASYKGPHHKAAGDHACVWNGVRACAAVIMGARGGLDVPAADMSGIKRHIGRHYEDFDKGKPPWEKEEGTIFTRLLKDFQALSSWGKDQQIDQICVEGLALKLLPDLAEFFGPVEDGKGQETADDWAIFQKDLQEVMNRLDRLEAEIDALKETVKPEPVADDEEDQGAEPPELVFGDEEKPATDADKAEADPHQAILEVAREVLGDAFQNEIDKLKGKIK